MCSHFFEFIDEAGGVRLLHELNTGESYEVVVTTGGGGWGDPLEREPERVLRDVVQAKVSPEAARSAYGVVLTGSANAYAVDEAATVKLRAELRAARKGPLPLIDRGPGFEKMLRGEYGPRV